MAVWAPGPAVLVCGDHLSPVEIPMISEGGSRDAYLETLERLAPLVERAATVVPGHGEPLEPARAMAILREDAAYLRALPDAPLPLARRGPVQAEIHADNLKRLFSCEAPTRRRVASCRSTFRSFAPGAANRRS